MSGSTIGGAVGAGIGYWVSGGTSQGTQAGWIIGSTLGGYIDPDVLKGPKLDKPPAILVQEGLFRPIIFGTVVTGGWIMHAGPLDAHTNQDRVGKGSGQVQETTTYTRTFAIGLAGHQIGNISRIWMNDKLVYDARNPADWPDAASAISAMAGESAKFATGFTFYNGSETQLPDPSLEALPEENGGGVGNVSAYRGTAYVVFHDFDVTEMGGAIPQFKFEVSCCGDTTTSTNPVAWVDSETGGDQSVFDSAVSGLTCFVCGDNGMLIRSRDGGTDWAAVDFAASTGWSSSAALTSIWHMDSQNTGGDWYLVKAGAAADCIAVSYNGGGTFSVYMTPVHDIVEYGVFVVNGTPWAGVSGTGSAGVNTKIFQPLSLSDTDIDLGGEYGEASCFGLVGGEMLIGTSTGYILDQSGNVRYHNTGNNTILQFAWDESLIALAAIAGGGYARSTDAGSAWTYIGTGTVGGFVWARNKFYEVGGEAIYEGADGLTWTQVDTSFLGNTGATLIETDGFSVVAAATETPTGLVAVLPSAYVLPDFASGWHIDPSGNIVGDTNTSVDRCTADLDATVLALCEMVGLTASQVDVTQLAGIPLRGFVINQRMTASAALRALQQFYFFDMPEWGDYTDAGTKIRCVLRGGASVVTVTDDDLVESDEDEDTRAQAVEFPRKINLETLDVESDYAVTKQSSERRTDNVKATGEIDISMSLTTLRDESAQVVEKMLKVAWEEAAGNGKRLLPEEFSVYTPSDPFVFNDRRYRLTNTTLGDGVTAWEYVRDRISAYTSTATAPEVIPPTVPANRLRGPTEFAAMNLPALTTSQNTPGATVAVCGLLDGWIGCDLYLSVDDQATWQLAATILTESTMGVLTADCTTSGTISTSVLHDHTLESATAAQIAARANAFAIVSGATAEVGQFQTATETGVTQRGDSIYDLTVNTRAELGTTAAAHYVNDRFVLFDGNTTFIPLDVSLAGRLLYFRPVSRGTVPANNRIYPFLFDPLFTSAPVIDFYTDASGEKYTDATGEYYYKVT